MSSRDSVAWNTKAPTLSPYHESGALVRGESRGNDE
jgi:hypothetical protein